MSLNALFIDGIPPWWSPSAFRSFMPLNRPMCSSSGELRLPAVDEGGGRCVGVVLDGDLLALGQLLELRREHRLRDRRLERLAALGAVRNVDIGLLAAAHVGLAGRADRVDHARRVDA